MGRIGQYNDNIKKHLAQRAAAAQASSSVGIPKRPPPLAPPPKDKPKPDFSKASANAKKIKEMKLKKDKKILPKL